jgi:N-acyl-D-aspartate/D-glutamate deacylase
VEAVHLALALLLMVTLAALEAEALEEELEALEQLVKEATEEEALGLEIMALAVAAVHLQ